MIPSEDSSGRRRRQGSITKAGNSSARRAFIEAAWAYAHPARVSWPIARRQTGLARSVTDLAWRAQLRLCARFTKLSARGLNRNKIVVAVARELSGFVWALAQNVKPIEPPNPTPACKETLSDHEPRSLIGNAVRPRMENPRRNVIDPASAGTPAPRARQLRDA